MLKNYLKIAFRNLLRNKVYSFISIGGLSLGLLSCILIYFFLSHELSYDKFHRNTDNIYRVNMNYHSPSGDITRLLNSTPALAPALREAFPEVAKTTQLRYAPQTSFRNKDRFFYETHGFYADSSFLDIFDFPLKQGNPTTALDAPNSIVMTQAMATKYFGDSNPVGQSISMNDEVALQVTGILEPVLSNSHIQFDFLISFPTYQVPPGVLADLSSWRWLGFLTYVQLVDGANPQIFQQNIQQLMNDRTAEGEIAHQPQVQALADIYYGSTGLMDDLNSHLKMGNTFTLYALAVIAILILLIAGFNFMNLTMATSTNRGIEIGIRKTLGADKGQLVFQLLNESVLIVLVSAVLGLGTSLAIFPHLKKLMEWHFGLNQVVVLSSIPILLLVAVSLGLLAGLYPTLLLTRKNTTSTLKKGGKTKSFGNVSLSNVLITAQFMASIGLITATVVVNQQIHFMQNKSLGFDQENVLMVKLLPDEMDRYYETFKTRLSQNPQVLSITQTNRLMGDPWPINSISVDGDPSSESRQIAGNWVGYDFLKTLAIPLKEGRSFSTDFDSDSTRSIVLNEKAVAYLGLENPIGKQVHFLGIDAPRTIIGVVKDFNYQSLHQNLAPAVLIMPFVRVQNVFIRVAPGNTQQTIASIQDEWSQIVPGSTVDIQFMDDHLNQQYESEKKLSYLINGFSFIALTLACLGLYGLVAFMVNNRKKEIGIRKVLGASAAGIVKMLSVRFVLLVALGFFIAIPVAWYAMNRWLADFAYRIEIGPGIFAIAGVSALAIALLTVSWQAVKAALANPVESLKSE